MVLQNEVTFCSTRIFNFLFKIMKSSEQFFIEKHVGRVVGRSLALSTIAAPEEP
jgi:hypothetical protein